MRCFSFVSGRFSLGEKTRIMGILNVTPDSFSDGGRFCTPRSAAAQAAAMERAGADLIDIGACSTRPGGEVIGETEELSRLSAVFPAVRAAVKAPLSVDTFRPAVAAYALQNGADIVNDVSGRLNPEMAEVINRFGAGWIVMHAGPPDAATADVLDYPGGVTRCVQAFFDRAVPEAAALGIGPERLCLDPGFGFAKTNAQNLELLRKLHTLDTHGCALLAALSRKRFVGALSGETEPEDRLFGTLAANAAAVAAGADLVRVHDVAEHVQFLRAADSLFRTPAL